MEGQGTGIDERSAGARRLAEDAGRFVMGHFGRLADVRRKGAVDLVTEADRGAEDRIRRGVAEAFPGDVVVGEEAGESGRADADWSWIVDPIDGTTNFVHGLTRFAVSIGLAHRGELVAGAIHVPPTGETFHAAVGQGAFCDDTPIAVSNTECLDDALLATGFPYDRRQRADELLRPVRRAMERARGVRRMGAAVLDFVDVARGVFDGFWEPGLGPWDMAAGVVLVREAGGEVSAYGGAPFDVYGNSVIVSNGRVHDELVSLVGRG